MWGSKNPAEFRPVSTMPLKGPVVSKLDEGVFSNLNPPAAGTQRLESFNLPPLDPEATLRSDRGWIFEGRSLKEESGFDDEISTSESESFSQAEATSSSESEAEAWSEVESEGEHQAESEVILDHESNSQAFPELLSERQGTSSSARATFVGDRSCRMALTAESTAHPMMNQDITVAFALEDLFRIQDSYTPSRARPLPDAYFGGTDDITDAIGFEDDTYTYIKFTKPLKTTDQDTDYCLLPEVNYLMILMTIELTGSH